MFHVPNHLRVRNGRYGSTDAAGCNGAFALKHKQATLRCIASDGAGWEHVSVSTPIRCPRWEEMCFVKAAFWGPEDVVMQLHPGESVYVDFHPYCLHLWRPIGVDIATPPSSPCRPPAGSQAMSVHSIAAHMPLFSQAQRGASRCGTGRTRELARSPTARGRCTATTETDMTTPNPEAREREALIAFLNGSAPLDGVWFGERHPGGPYWWRSRLASITPQAEPATDSALVALRELVALKDMKDSPEYVLLCGTVADYERRKPLAWAAARAVVASHDCVAITADASPSPEQATR